MTLDWTLDDSCQALIAEIRRHYRLGLPAPLSVRDGGTIQAEDMLEIDTDLAGYESPYILALIAARDPLEQLGVAAAARFTSKIGGSQVGAEAAKLIMSGTRHRTVMETIETARASNYSPRGVAEARRFARRMADADRSAARLEMTDLLNRVIATERPRDRLVEELVAIGYRCGLKQAGFRRVALSILDSRRVGTGTKLVLVEKRKLLPFGLGAEIERAVREMPALPDGTLLQARLAQSEIMPQARPLLVAPRPTEPAGDGDGRLVIGRGPRRPRLSRR